MSNQPQFIEKYSQASSQPDWIPIGWVSIKNSWSNDNNKNIFNFALDGCIDWKSSKTNGKLQAQGNLNFLVV